jgi:hypothetical protein
MEAWLRGPEPGVDPVLAPLLFSLRQAAEDLTVHTEGLAPAQIWARPGGLTPIGFHLRHIAGSVDRLTTYLGDRPLDAQQSAGFEAESREPADPASEPVEALLALVRSRFERASAVVRALDPTMLAEPRAVGRKRLPTTVAGLLVHIAEHTARHVGLAVAAAKVVRAGL